MDVRFEKQKPGPLADPAWGIMVRFRPFQFGVMLGLRAFIVESDRLA
jgi:hypothetical protein